MKLLSKLLLFLILAGVAIFGMRVLLNGGKSSDSAIQTAREKLADQLDPRYSPAANIKDRLTSMQFEVTQNEATEPPFKNEYFANKEPGIYVDIVSGEPLFSSKDKFKSGTGWPSFTRPLVSQNVFEVTDYLLGYARTEVRSLNANSHLGHVFNDGPEPTGLRYCINSAALKFISAKDLADKGYEEFAADFDGE